MEKNFVQVDWNEAVEDDCRQLIRLAVREDLGRGFDWTTLALTPQGARATAGVAARSTGVVAGLPALELVFREMDIDADCRLLVADGGSVSPGTKVAEISGAARDLLTSERLILNFLGKLSGIATSTRRFVNAVTGTGARIYDTRKTTPGWRRLEKYAVRCGGGHNHRTGLFDAVLIKDNHLAVAGAGHTAASPSEAVAAAKKFLTEMAVEYPQARNMIVEVEVDTLDQLRDVLPADPDIVLLDNMSIAELQEAVSLRDRLNARVDLEASGGITLDSVRGIAGTGVERISVGALTHSAPSFDVGLDW